MRRTLLLALIAALCTFSAPAVAQQTAAGKAAAPLARIETMVAGGAITEARSALEEWWKSAAGGDRAPAPTKARALSLRARLAADPRAAEEDYLALALGYPSAPEAPGALLALGQLLHALGELPRAENYLARAAADYPGSSERPVALLWLARTRAAAGKREGACIALRDALASPSDPELAALLQGEQGALCTTPSPTTERVTQPPTPATSAPRYTVQAGAFKNTQGARTLADRLRKAGFETRIALVPGSTLLRVRAGTFDTAADAETTLARLRAAGFDGAIASDAHRERPAP